MTSFALGQVLPPVEVIAFNFAEESSNRIHSDEVAAQYGFAGGLVMLGIIGVVLGIRPRVLDMHLPWYLRGGPRLVEGAESPLAQD